MTNKLVFLFIFVAHFLIAQNITVTGKIFNSENKPIEDATVSLMRAKDSSVIGFTGTSKSGHFNLKVPQQNSATILQISANHAKTMTRKLPMLEKNLQLGEVKLDRELISDIEEVTIVASPVTIKKDTVEYNASYLKVKPDDKIDELLKQIPGVETDDDGNITVNGQPVNKILINGKPFFNKDGKIALETFNADIIRKIQITTSKTKEEALTKRTPVSDSLTVNFNIDERNNKGNILNANLGYGTDKRYDVKLLLARFKQNTNYAFIAGSNNINISDFSVDGFFEKNNRNNSANGRTARNGILRTSTFGVNYADKIGDNFDLEKFSLEYKDSNFETHSKTSRTTFLPDYQLGNNSERGATTDRQVFNFNTDGSVKLDPLTTIIISANFANNNTQSNSFSNVATFRDDAQLNSNSGTANGSSVMNSFRPKVSVVRNFAKPRRSLTASIDNTFSDSNAANYNRLETVFFQNPDESRSRNQLSDNRSTRNLFGADLKYYEPVSDSATVGLEMNYDLLKMSDRISVNDFDAATGQYSSFNPLLSNILEQNNNLLNLGLIYNLNKSKYNLRLGPTLNMTNLELNSFYNFQEFNLRKNYVLPGYNFLLNYKFSKSTTLRFSNNSSYSVPQATRLNPYTDISDPLVTITGNPDLKSTWNNSSNFNFTTFNTAKGINFNTRLNFRYSNNDIANFSFYDDSGKQYITYANISGNKALGFATSFTKTYKWAGNKLDINPSFSANHNFRKGFIDGSEFTNAIWNYTPRLNVNFNWKDKMSLRTTYLIGFSNSHYTNYRVDQNNSSRQMLSVRLTNYFLGKNIFFNNDFTYSKNSNVTAGFDRDSYFWNSSVSYQFYKKQMMLKFSVNDLLNQRQNANRIIGDNYIEDREELVLKRYFMLSLIFKLNKVG